MLPETESVSVYSVVTQITRSRVPQPADRTQLGAVRLFGKSFPPWTFSFPTGLIPRTLGPFNVMLMLYVMDMFAW